PSCADGGQPTETFTVAWDGACRLVPGYFADHVPEPLAVTFVGSVPFEPVLTVFFSTGSAEPAGSNQISTDVFGAGFSCAPPPLTSCTLRTSPDSLTVPGAGSDVLDAVRVVALARLTTIVVTVGFSTRTSCVQPLVPPSRPS